MSTQAATVDDYKVHDRLDGLATTLVLILCLAWGLNYVSMKIVNQGLQPVFQTSLRFGLAAILVYGWCVVRRVPLFRRDGTLIAGILAGVLFGVEFALISTALDYTSASRSIVFVYTMPFFVAIGAHLFVPGERMGLHAFVGLVLAFSGVAVVFSDKLSLPSPEAVYGDILCVVAAVLWGGNDNPHQDDEAQVRQAGKGAALSAGRRFGDPHGGGSSVRPLCPRHHAARPRRPGVPGRHRRVRHVSGLVLANPKLSGLETDFVHVSDAGRGRAAGRVSAG